ncbi:MAG: DMT family transporter [Pseudomonadota bacterium]
MSLDRVLGPMLGVLTVLCWSGYNVAAKHGIEAGLPPEALAFLRFSVPGVLALPVLVLLALRGRALGVSVWRLAVLVALGGPVFGLVAVTGYVHAPLSYGLLFAPVAVFLSSAVLRAVLLRERVTGQRLGAAAVMFAGLALLVGLDLRALAPGWGQGALFFVLAGCMWGSYTVLLRHWRIPMVEGAVGMAAGSAMLALPLLGPTGVEPLRAAPVAELVVQVVMQGIVGGVVSVVALIGAVRWLSGQTAALLPVFTPVVALGIALAAFGDVPSVAEAIGVTIIAAGFLIGLGLSTPLVWPKLRVTTDR